MKVNARRMAKHYGCGNGWTSTTKKKVCYSGDRSMRINKLDIIIPTWNSMPEIENTLESLVPALGDKIGRIIIVDKFSNDATVNTVINWGVENDISIHLIHTEASLGTARKMGYWNLILSMFFGLIVTLSYL